MPHDSLKGVYRCCIVQELSSTPLTVPDPVPRHNYRWFDVNMVGNVFALHLSA